MKESALKEKLDIIEGEINTLADKIEDLDNLEKTIKDIQIEMKGLKVFLSRVNPEFKKQFPEIIKKLEG